MGTPTTKDLLAAYLLTKGKYLDDELVLEFGRSTQQMPHEVLRWIGEFFYDLANGEVQCKEGVTLQDILGSILTRLDLATVPTLAERLQQEQLDELRDTYSWLVNRWNWTEGPASKKE